MGCRLVVRKGVFRRLSDVPIDRLPVTATAITPMSAIAGFDFLVIDEEDFRRWEEAAAAGIVPSPTGSSERLVRLSDGAYIAWLSSADEARTVLTVLRDETLRRIEVAALDQESHAARRRLYDLAWRLVCCAVSDDDVFLAAATLKMSPHPERGDHLLSSYFPNLSPAERHTKLAEARARIEKPAATTEARVAASVDAPTRALSERRRG